MTTRRVVFPGDDYWTQRKDTTVSNDPTSDEDELAASLRSTLLVSMADAAGIRLAPNGEGGLTAALEVETEDGAWRFVLPRKVCMQLLAQCAAVAEMTPEQARALAAQLHQEYLDGQAEASE